MGLMELEVARMEHRLRAAEAERRNGIQRTIRERKRCRQQETEPAQPRIEWPLVTVRFGRFQLALLRTVTLPAESPASGVAGRSGLLPG